MGYRKHALNFLSHESLGALAFDLTTFRHIAAGREDFQMLAVGATDLDALLHRLGGLYGGDWTVMGERELARNHRWWNGTR